MMRITQDFLNHLSPVELSFIRTGIDKLYKEKVTPDTTNYENVESHVQRLLQLRHNDVKHLLNIVAKWLHRLSLIIPLQFELPVTL